MTRMSLRRRLCGVELALIALLAGIIGWATSAWLSRWSAPLANGRDQPLRIERLTELSQLLTLRIDVADVVVTHLAGWTGGVDVLLAVRGDVSLGIDLSRARLEAVDRTGHTAIVVLPPPTRTGARLDWEGTRVFALDAYGIWALAPNGRARAVAINRALRTAQQQIDAAATDRGADERARARAEVLIVTFCRTLGWDVQVRWHQPKAR
jgi:hypothetical protein